MFQWIYNPIEAYFDYLVRVGLVQCFIGKAIKAVSGAVGGLMGGSGGGALGTFLGGPVGGLVGSIGGDLLGNAMNRSSAQQNQRFQERLSNTSYQRAMQDMKAAGLNPMLVSKLGGASTPSGSMAPQSFSNPVDSANTASIAGQTARNLRATGGQIKQNTRLAAAQADLAATNAAFESAWKRKMIGNDAAMSTYIMRQATGDSTVATARGVGSLLKGIFNQSKKNNNRTGYKPKWNNSITHPTFHFKTGDK